MYAEHLKNFEQTYLKLVSNYGEYTVFSDFVKMCAISIYNSFAKDEKMEQEYLNTINSYEKEEQSLFPKMFGELIMMYEDSKDDITDILGPFYEKEHLGNSHIGQFFTPHHISDLMAEMTVGEEETIKSQIEKNGFITMCEPTCGAGGMVLSYVKALAKRHINYQQDLLVEATDISDVCAYMTYIQLSLYGIPAVVYCGNTLTLDMRFKMETPLFYLNYWKFRKFYKKVTNVTQNEQEENLIDENELIIENVAEQTNLFKEVTIKGNCQISLW